MGRMSRQKGKRGEREAAAELGQLLGVAARRGVQFQGGPDSPDVVLDGVAIHVEAKRVERLQLWPALEQAAADAPAGKVPVVWHKANRRASVVVVETSRLLELAREIVRATSASKSGTQSVQCDCS
jgi:Holliday junction resolvase